MPALASKSKLHALAAQAAAAALAGGTKGTQLQLTAGLVGRASRAAVSTGPAYAFGFQVSLLNAPPGQITPLSGILILQSGGNVVLGVGPSPGPNVFPAAIGILISGGGQVWTATQGNEVAQMDPLPANPVTCSGTVPSMVTSCVNATFTGTAVPPATQTGAELSITASEPEAGGATGSRTATVLPQPLVGVSLSVDCAVTSLCTGTTTGAGQLFFFAGNDGVHGFELWRTDGTSSGTVMVKDINPDAGSSSPSGFTAFNGFTYFAANDGDAGVELWRTDGTANGTTMVDDLLPGKLGSGPLEFTVLGNELYFTAGIPGSTRAVWKTDGGTTVQLSPTTGGPLLLASGLYPFNGKIYFSGRTAAEGFALWSTDGTNAGTQLIKDTNPQTGIAGLNGVGTSFAVLGGELYFGANDGNGAGIWKTDGTGPNTVEVTHGIDAGLVSDLHVANVSGGGQALFFQGVGGGGGATLWVVDGALAEGAMPLPGGTPTYPAVLNGQLFYGCQLPPGGLCTSDGTVAGTRVLTNGNPNDVRYMAPALGVLFFRGSGALPGPGSTSVGFELYKYDATGAGTTLVRDIVPGGGSSSPAGFVELNGKVVFQATTPELGTELWVTNGTDAGTVLLKDILPGPGSGIPPAF
jgi:ELWxxDGT repeat protein